MKKLLAVVALSFLLWVPAFAGSFSFSTGSPDGKIATTSGNAKDSETADDFLLTQQTTLTSATFVGLLPAGISPSNVTIEIYGIFPVDSNFPPDGNVLSRVNSPSDVEMLDRSSGGGNATFSTTVLSSSFTAANSVDNGINKLPNQFTGGEGPVTEEEVEFDVTFTTPISLGPGHYFFVPQVSATGGDFLWLSAPKPITGGTGPFLGDLQTWIRNSDLNPDWSRVGTDITHQGPFNATFSLAGTVPEPGSFWLLVSGALGFWGSRKLRTSK